ncbi:MAG: ribosomal L7Ae/L30e/S12e/Gadd45 family protein [Lachnospiraceae bacterium]|nr:ribosomal L7Ae/L30e/S12e/Gadd45 family protein [Lachnospiraceae bacterium]
MLSIAAKAGKVKSGGFLVEKALQENNAQLVLIAKDASDNTKKKFKQKCEFYKIPYYTSVNSELLGKSIGKEARVVVVVTDAGLANQIVNGINSSKDLEV